MLAPNGLALHGFLRTDSEWASQSCQATALRILEPSSRTERTTLLLLLEADPRLLKKT